MPNPNSYLQSKYNIFIDNKLIYEIADPFFKYPFILRIHFYKYFCIIFVVFIVQKIAMLLHK